ncbi:MAG: DUF4443 domain-containing protein [Promethearchaeota archaeon]
MESKTIAPSYNYSQIIYSIMLLGEDDFGIGRYRIKNEIDLGEGSTKTLLNHLKKQEIITVLGSRQKGHILTNKGKKFFQNITEVIPKPNPLENTKNKYVVGNLASYTHLKSKYLKENINLGILQRDEAIKIGGTGATCLIFDGTKFVFPEHNRFPIEITSFNTSSFHEGDLLIIGGGKSTSYANLATIAAAISLLDF